MSTFKDKSRGCESEDRGETLDRRAVFKAFRRCRGIDLCLSGKVLSDFSGFVSLNESLMDNYLD